jgi:hypothetical protein
MTGTEDKQIVYNSIKCLECNETLVSYHVHDYKVCGCDNHASVDGGTYYIRIGAKDLEKVDVITVYADDPFEIVRTHATRGGRGKSGKEPLKWIPISEMDTDHIEAVLEYGGADWHLDLLRKELKFRENVNKS